MIEVDGNSYFTKDGQIRDIERTRILESYGLKVIRFTNHKVHNAFEGVYHNLSKMMHMKD